MKPNYEINKESIKKLFPKEEINILGYESPIQIMLGQMRLEQENGVYKAIQEQGVTVDKDELIKALRYDRDQYDKGYINGYLAKASEVAREIFEEIDDLLRQHYVDWDFCYYDDYLGEDFEKIKKKYTEEGK